MAAAPRRFRAAQREMAVAQEVISTVPAFRIDGDADTDPDTMLPRASHERYFEGAGDPFRGVLDAPQDISAALEALDVARREPGGAPAGGAPAGGTSGSGTSETSEEVIARSKDPKLGRYLKMRSFGER